MMLKNISILALVAISLSPGMAVAQDTVSPAVRWAQVAACGAERSNEARHACVDSIMRAADVLDTETEAAINLENFGRDEREAPPPARTVPPVEGPQETALQSAPQPAPPPPAQIDGITTHVASARISGTRRVEVTTSEGAIWRQTDSKRITRLPREGEIFEVSEGTLGSYRCTFNETTSFRCARRD